MGYSITVVTHYKGDFTKSVSVDLGINDLMSMVKGYSTEDDAEDFSSWTPLVKSVEMDSSGAVKQVIHVSGGDEDAYVSSAKKIISFNQLDSMSFEVSEANGREF